jgi:hypothetical protein
MQVVPALDEVEDREFRLLCVRKRCLSSNSHSRVALKLSHIALS